MRFQWLTLLILAALASAVYAIGLRGPFLFDDHPNIVQNFLVAIDSLELEVLRDASFSASESHPQRGLARLTFALNYYLAGQQFDVFAFKATNLLIHVLNGWLVYWLSRALLRRYAASARPVGSGMGHHAMPVYVPALVAAAWLLHPIQLTTVLYVVQRMTSLSALFVFLGLLTFVWGRIRFEQRGPSGLGWMAAGLGVGGLLGVLCKENAALLPCFALLIEWFFFQRRDLSHGRRRSLYVFYGALVLVPLAVVFAVAFLKWDSVMGQYIFREFTPYERLLTEARVLFLYLGLIFVPRLGSFGLYHDDLIASTGLLEPWTTLASVAGLAALVILAVCGMRRRALWSFAVAWFLVGHAMESTVLPLELVHEHRNYVPTFGVLFAAVVYLVRGLQILEPSGRTAIPIAGTLVLALGFTTFSRASIWEDFPTLAHFMVRNHPDSYRSLITQSHVAIETKTDAREIYAICQRAASARPSAVQPLIEMAKIASQMKHRIDHGTLLEPVASDDDSGFNQSAREGSALERPLVLSGADLEEVVALVDVEMRDRLERYPVSAQSRGALVQLGSCIRKGLDTCVPLFEEARHWHRIAVANHRISEADLAALHSSLSSLYLRIDRTDLAIEHARIAAAMRPKDMSHKFNLAHLYIGLDRWDEVGVTLESLESNRHWSGFRGREIRLLRRDYEHYLAEQAKHAS